MAGAHAKPTATRRTTVATRRTTAAAAAWAGIFARILFITIPVAIWEGILAGGREALRRAHSLFHTPQHKAGLEMMPTVADATWDHLPGTEADWDPVLTAPPAEA